MQNAFQAPVVPWIVPELPHKIKQIFYKLGEKSVVNKGFVGHDESLEPDPLIMVNKGYFFHGVANKYLSKNLAISLLPQGRMNGFINLFTRERMPSLSGALTRSEIFTVPYRKFVDAVKEDHKLFVDFSLYQERCNKSDMYGMLYIMTHPIEERLKLLFAATLLSFGYAFEPSTLDNWVQIPLKYTRGTMARVAYASGISITRILAQWMEEGALKRESNKLFIKPRKIIYAYDWIMERT